ncbi:membrane protein [[Pantoea] beijingensis]|uniref:Membrane protein n=2 Tax=[Pantoea] beijingensis TaxID=1324864 RepID=A0A443I9P4_9GAMM|nr:membrane protein [[Pantoea] beijingensis]
MTLNYSPDDYDQKGQLRLPLSFWIVLLLQARTWVLFVVAGASRQQGTDLLTLFYPDAHAFWLGLALGIPAAFGLLLTGYRQRLPGVWQAWRWVLCAALVAMMLSQAVTLWQGDETFSPLVGVFGLFDLLALGYLTLNRRLRHCFDRHLNAAE